MCDMLDSENYAKVESALVSGSMPADSYGALLDRSNQKHYEDMDVGDTMELSLGQKTVTVTISGVLDAAKIANGHGALAMDTAVLPAPEELFRELMPEIKAFDYSWSIVCDSKKSESGLIFLFGVVNLINTTLSNQVSRKRENSILRSVGLTGKQLFRMDVIEGMCYMFCLAWNCS